jgi:phosphatidylglycerophosphate synthase
VPNVIGYSRIVLAAFALFYMPYHPKACTLLYGISCLLDAVDGQAARALGQTSKFGAVLDMVTDRWVASPVRLSRCLCLFDLIDVPPLDCFVTSPRRILLTRSFSNS